MQSKEWRKRVASLLPGRLWRVVGFLAATLRLLRRLGPIGFAREVSLRIGGRFLHGIPVTSPASYIKLNRDYREWLRSNAPEQADLRAMHNCVQRLDYQPLISILVPVYNTRRRLLVECIESVRKQAYEHWELCLVNDASTEPHVQRLLDDYARRDPKVRLKQLTHNVGIAAATQHALEMASGEFVALLDHDDELTPDALFAVINMLNRRPDCDLIYSDEDKRSPQGTLVEPFFKPGWSPDLLRSMNYITHLSVLRTSVVKSVGGFRPGFDGSQDYDLLLRITDTTDRIAHIPVVLYHWRKTAGSAALHADAKPYAYDAAVRALRESLDRRGLAGSINRETPGHYSVRYNIGERPPIALLALGSVPDLVTTAYPDVAIVVGKTLGDLARRIPQRAAFVVLCDGRLRSLTVDWVDDLMAHAQRSEVGAAGPILINDDGTVGAAGLYVGVEGRVEPAFAGWNPDETRAYSGMLQSTRNCSALAGCLMMRRSVLDQVGVDDQLHSPAAEVDLCLRLRKASYDVVCVPHVRMHLTGSLLHSEDQLNVVRDRWPDEFSGRDPFLNPNLVTTSDGLRIKLDVTGHS